MNIAAIGHRSLFPDLTLSMAAERTQLAFHRLQPLPRETPVNVRYGARTQFETCERTLWCAAIVFPAVLENPYRIAGRPGGIVDSKLTILGQTTG
jgi:hypothetical protein